ncbi:MAG: HAMP domain-containing histidine kinase [Roseburia sp.]|nr:HAMP domain-containing histidine kinase [Roseburia sp.]
MFKKVRLRLTLLSGIITTLILIIMTLAYLYISEQNLINARLLSFRNDINTIATNLEQQDIITHQWLSGLENNGYYYISLMDNGAPFLFNSRANHSPYAEILAEGWAQYELLRAAPATTLSYSCMYRDFSFTARAVKNDTLVSKNVLYYGCVITLSRPNGTLEMLLLSSLETVNRQKSEQRLVFLAIIIVALAAIWLFTWHFIGRLLLPIEESRRRQTRFIAAASHELRTPLAVLLSCMDSCERTPDNISALLPTMKDEGMRMAGLINDMLTLLQHDNHALTLAREPIEADTLLLNSCEAFEPMARQKGLSLRIELPDGAVPPCLCDTERIRQVIAILIHNAISYTPIPDTGITSEILLRLECPSEHRLRISVIDHGIGIADDEKDKIFECFYRSEKSRSAKGHFGLGLCIAYEIIQAHHGKIAVTDTDGGGATFTVTLPC